jgi:hypothetical protein
MPADVSRSAFNNVRLPNNSGIQWNGSHYSPQFKLSCMPPAHSASYEIDWSVLIGLSLGVPMLASECIGIWNVFEMQPWCIWKVKLDNVHSIPG